MVPMNADKNANAYEDWVSNGIKSIDKVKFETGKFLFSVSSGSIGVVITLFSFLKIQIETPGWLGLIAFILSAAIAIQMVIPKIIDIAPQTAIEPRHNNEVESLKRSAWAWFAIWALGLAFVSTSVVGIAGQADKDAPPLKVELIGPEA